MAMGDGRWLGVVRWSSSPIGARDRRCAEHVSGTGPVLISNNLSLVVELLWRGARAAHHRRAHARVPMCDARPAPQAPGRVCWARPRGPWLSGDFPGDRLPRGDEAGGRTEAGQGRAEAESGAEEHSISAQGRPWFLNASASASAGALVKLKVGQPQLRCVASRLRLRCG